MKILKLISIDGFIEGGSSKPLRITAVDDDGDPCKYVMKLYKEKYVEECYTVAKEIFVSELAEEFNLSVPEYAIINIDHSLLEDYFTPDEINKFDKGYKFCTKFQEAYTIFNPISSLKFVKNYDIANIFAFDNTITNIDRGGARNKPNLLINDDEILLIDHEQSLPFINSSFTETNHFTYLRSYQYNLHVVYKYLKSIRDKEGFFDEFSEMISVININKFNNLFDELDEFKIKYSQRDDFFVFLHWIKTNRVGIINHLTRIVK